MFCVQTGLPPLTGLILAGGAGTRMGGGDKGLMVWRGQTLVAWVAQALRPHVVELLISANRHPTAYRAYADRLVPDAEPDYPGPLAGVLAGLQAAHTAWVLCAPCDMPLLHTAVLQRLFDTWQRERRTIVAHDGLDIQPTLALLPRAALPQLQARYAAGERSLRRAFAHLQPAVAPCADLAADLRNCNTPEDLQRLAYPPNAYPHTTSGG